MELLEVLTDTSTLQNALMTRGVLSTMLGPGLKGASNLQLTAEWHGKVTLNGARNKAALPKNLRQRIAQYFHDSFVEISEADSHEVKESIKILFHRSD
ncbi:hypothetical protein UY3_11467 [Chelonia mydas]|uniref:Uncharacterized protein n=1 Tax=Chelonia mydas TaxID=8469 RepID=M7B7A2_CHEMY|nr:hypothetical protein UY3_11467 [Chelonia mydas]